MRMHDAFEAYLDDYNSCTIYMRNNFFGGNSQIFHLKDSKGNIIPLEIESKINLPSDYKQYNTTIKKPLTIGESYTVFDEHAKKTPANYSHIVKTRKFYDDFDYEGDDLGFTYTKKETTFKIWTPVAHQVMIKLIKDGKTEVLPMTRGDKGVWSITVKGDWLGADYTYMININGNWAEAEDPYNPFIGVNRSTSQVWDFDQLKLPEKIQLEPMTSNTDAIIYEASIRDMTSQTGVGVEHPMKFLGFVEETPTSKAINTGFSYLKSLGITHVQLLPVFQFGSVDEENPTMFYNWGYDPMHYRALEGAYSTNPYDGKVRFEEFAKMVNELHKAGIKVNLDLVFNHVDDKGQFALEKMVPNYFFLMNRAGEFSNGSFCGNDIDTQPPMSKKYFLDTCKKIVEWFDVDGFRFDLMGILDINLMNEIVEECRKIKPDFMVYGEGWNMPSFVEEGLRATQLNQYKMPNVGHFSDRFREQIRGNNGILEKRGYASGCFDNLYETQMVMAASCKDNVFSSPQKVVNFVECHDNHTLWDKNRIACVGESKEDRERRQIIANAIVLLSQGIPFLHAGQEFGRTKQNIGNSYNRSDNYNRIDYFRRDRHKYIVERTKELIEIRKNHPSFRLDNAQEIKDRVSFETMENQVIVYRTEDESERLVTFFNPSRKHFSYNLNQQGEILFDLGNENSKVVSTVQIAPLSVVVVKLK